MRPIAIVTVVAMLLTMPLVAIQGPGNTTPMDAVNLLFLIVYWVIVLVRHEPMSLPLRGPLWLILFGSMTGFYAAVDHEMAALTVVQELYLWTWFVTMVHFLTRWGRLGTIATLWAGVAVAVAIATVADARMGLFGGELAGAGGSDRALGTFENPNMYGSYLIVAFFVTWAVAAAGRRVLYAALPALAAGVLSTASNGAFMGLLGGCFATVASYGPARERAGVGVLLVVGALGLGVVGLWHEQVESAAVAVLSSERGDVGGAALKGAGERYPLWLDAFAQFRQAPTGVGPGNFNIRRGPASGTYYSAHNDYLGMLAERGLFGLVGWCLLLGTTFIWVGALASRPGPGLRPLAIEPLYGLVAAITLHAAVIELSHFRHVWFAWAIVCAAAAQTRASSARVPELAVLREAA